MSVVDIIHTYENMYNQELTNRRDLDSKFSSRITLYSANILLMGGFLRYFIQNGFIKIDLFHCLFYICMIFFIMESYYLYNCFFRLSLTYREMPITEIRMYHFYIGNQYDKKIMEDYSNINHEEESLLTYIKDSYLFCAYHNSKENTRRSKYINKFDNIAILNIILLVANYFVYIFEGGDIKWIIFLQ